MTRYAFTKMHGLGNDFVVVNRLECAVDLSPEQIRYLSDRRTGVGFDQLLCLEPPPDTTSDFHMRVFNADGGRAEHCGNGLRCVARFIERLGIFPGSQFRIAVGRRVTTVRLEEDGDVSCDMGVPEFEPKGIPFLAPAREACYELEVESRTLVVSAVSMGNPHAVLLVDDVRRAPVCALGPEIEHHARFPRGANAGFMQVLDARNIALRVHERGVGETLACGTGACAAVACGRELGLLEDRVAVGLPGGRLHIEWPGGGSSLWMRGPAVRVFEGSISL